MLNHSNPFTDNWGVIVYLKFGNFCRKYIYNVSTFWTKVGPVCYSHIAIIKYVAKVQNNMNILTFRVIFWCCIRFLFFFCVCSCVVFIAYHVMKEQAKLQMNGSVFTNRWHSLNATSKYLERTKNLTLKYCCCFQVDTASRLRSVNYPIFTFFIYGKQLSLKLGFWYII